MSTLVWSPPGYRIGRRRDDKSALIVVFAAADRALRAALTVQISRHLRARTSGALVVVEQETDEIVTVRELPLAAVPSTTARDSLAPGSRATIASASGCRDPMVSVQDISIK